MRQFSIVDAFNWAFKTVFNNFGLFFSAGILYFLVTNGEALLALAKCGTYEGDWWQFFIQFSACRRNLGWPFTAIGFLLVLVAFWLLFGLMRIAFDFYDHGESKFKRIFSQGNLLLRGLVAYMLLAFIFALPLVITGMIIALRYAAGIPFGAYFSMLISIIPGIYVLCRYVLVFTAYVDKDMGIKRSFAYSAKLTDGNKWKILGLLLCIALVSIIPFIGIIIGLLALVHAYRSLQEGESETKDVPETVYEEEVVKS